VDTLRLATPHIVGAAALLAQFAGHGGAVGALVLQNVAWVLLGSMIALCTVAAWITPTVALRAQGLPVLRNLSSLLVLFLLGCGVSLNNTIEAGKALLTNRDWAFKRTPKYAVRHGQEEWRDKRYQVPLDPECLLELSCVCLGGVAIADAIWQSSLAALLILIPYTTAYAFVLWLTIRQSRRRGSS
jgi:hypothetical protein